MPNVTGPLFSLSARGTVAKQLTYAESPKTPYVKRYATPSNPQTPAQTAQRFGIQAITQAWANVPTAERAAWEATAAATRTSPYHAYLRHNAARWATGLPPVPSPAAPGLTIPDPTYTSIYKSAGLYHFNLENENAPGPLWGLQLCLDQTTDPTDPKTQTFSIPTGIGNNPPRYDMAVTFEHAEPVHFAYRIISLAGDVSPWYFATDEEPD